MSLLRKPVYYYLILIFALLLCIEIRKIHCNLVLSTCEPVSSTFIEIKSAYYNWPFRLDCDSLTDKWFKKSTENVLLDTCQITDDKETKFPGIWELDKNDVKPVYTAYMNKSTGGCIKGEISVNFINIPSESCKKSIKTSHEDGTILLRSGMIRIHESFQCYDSESQIGVIPKGADPSQFTTTWYKECKFDNPDDDGIRYGTFVKEKGRPDALRIDGTDFYSAGNYTCVVSYKGRSLNVVNYNFCIKQNPSYTSYQPTISCSNTTVAKGQTAKLSCKGQVAIGTISDGDLSITWTRNKKTLCTNVRYNDTQYEHGGKYSCYVNGDNSTIRCEDAKYGYENLVVQEPRREVSIHFIIKEVSVGDFESPFHVTLKHRDYTEAKGAVSLQRDMAPEYKYLRDKVLTPVLITLGLLMLITALGWWFKLEIKVLAKRFFGHYAADNKLYAFYLLYEYDAGDQSADYIKKIRKVINKKSEDLEYNFFEEQREPSGKVLVEIITNNVKQSHCMLAIVTKNFIQNNWARFQSEVSISSSTPIIFIYTPGSKKLLRKANGWKKISTVARVSYSINWTPKMTDEKLARHLELALPKLKRSRLQEYNRCISNSTTIEILPSPSPGDSGIADLVTTSENSCPENAIN